MTRKIVPLLAAAIALTGSAYADALWQLSDDYASPAKKPAPAKPEEATPPATVLPLSGNTILGRTQWVDTQARLGVLVLHRSPSHADEPLVARTEDCTPCAILRQVPTGTRPGVVAVKVVAGELKPGMEIVLPVESLLKQARASLKNHEATAPAATVVPAKPVKAAAPAAPTGPKPDRETSR